MTACSAGPQWREQGGSCLCPECLTAAVEAQVTNSKERALFLREVANIGTPDAAPACIVIRELFKEFAPHIATEQTPAIEERMRLLSRAAHDFLAGEATAAHLLRAAQTARCAWMVRVAS